MVWRFLKKSVIGLLIVFTITMQAATLDLRLAAFIPQSQLFRAIYGTAAPSYQIEALWRVHDRLHAWSNLSYIHARGNSIPLCIKTQLQLLPMSIGLKVFYGLHESVHIYAGAGICYTFLKESNTICLSNKAHNVGGIFKLGILKKHNCVNFSVFSDYQLQKFTIKKASRVHCVNAGGLYLGGSIGIIF